MRKLLYIFISILTCVSVFAAEYDYISFQTANENKALSTTNLVMKVQNQQLVVTNATGTNTFSLSDLTTMYFSDGSGQKVDTTTTVVEADSNLVTVVYSASSVAVTVSKDIANYVTYSADGAHLTVTQSDKVDDAIGEITYSLSGGSSNGSFTLNGSYKASIDLYGLTLTNPNGPALNIQDGKRINISSKVNTINTLSDAANGDWKGAIVSKGHTEFKGKGTLNISGLTKHAVWSKEYMEVKNCTINISSAVKDAINCNQYFLMESGLLNIRGYGDDGIQVSYKDETPTDEEDTGNIEQTGGVINIYTAGSTGDALNYDGQLLRTGGELNIITDETSVEYLLRQDQVEVYTLLGFRLGAFQTEEDALSRLSRGIYVIKSEGVTKKICLQ